MLQRNFQLFEDLSDFTLGVARKVFVEYDKFKHVSVVKVGYDRQIRHGGVRIALYVWQPLAEIFSQLIVLAVVRQGELLGSLLSPHNSQHDIQRQVHRVQSPHCRLQRWHWMSRVEEISDVGKQTSDVLDLRRVSRGQLDKDPLDSGIWFDLALKSHGALQKSYAFNCGYRTASS